MKPETDRDEKTPVRKMSPLATTTDIANVVERFTGLLVVTNEKLDRFGQQLASQNGQFVQCRALCANDRIEAQKDRRTKNILSAALAFAGTIIAAAIMFGAAVYNTHTAVAKNDLAQCHEAGRQGALAAQPSTEAIAYQAARRGAADEHAAMLREMPGPILAKPPSKK